ncbi:MAG: EAL domain-containing protein [Rhodocyclales bacterium GT-UBC]|nr:MAG: EAL domain-containing protein [Rhodocyclales bacterium GT-UBC]
MAYPLISTFRTWSARQNRLGWRGLLVGSIALSLILLLAAWSLTWQRLDIERRWVLRTTSSQQENLATIIAENLNQVLDRGRLISIAANEWFDGNPRDAAKRLSSMHATDRAILRIALYDARQRRVYASTPASDSPLFKQALNEAWRAPGDAQLRFAPIPERGEQAWQLPLLFPVQRPDGKVQGLLLVSLDLGYFLDLYRQIDIGSTGAIGMLRQDAYPLIEARQEGLSLPQPQRVASLPAPNGSNPSSHSSTGTDGQTYLNSLCRLERYPFIVTVSRQQNDVLAEHADSRARTIAVLVTLSLIILLFTFRVGRSIRHQGQLLSALAGADHDKQRLIERLEEEKKHAFELAAHDPLTGLPNRRMFNELASSHLSRAKRSRKYYALLYVDLDRFKQINDSLGHHVGDLLLQTIAARLRSALRESDVIARLGGDEFALLLTGLDHIGDAGLIAGKIVDLVKRPCLNLDGNDIETSPSIGIALFPRDGQDFATLCRNADAAMYQSKRSGRGRYSFYDPALNPASNPADHLEQGLSKAIENNELTLHFQPRIRLSDYRIVGLEALVRWQHPEFGLIYPDDFIPLAERNGLIVALDDWVAAAACQKLAEWRAAGCAPVPLSINVSANRLQAPSFTTQLAELMATHKLPASALEIEITEQTLIESIETAGQTLRALEAHGVRITLDDFGKGFANLARIRGLPIHNLKIDRTLIGDIRNSPDDAAIVTSIITLAHNLHMRVIAEGVELLDQLVHLKTAGCDEVQGYYFSRPVPGNAVRQLLDLAVIPPP